MSVSFLLQTPRYLVDKFTYTRHSIRNGGRGGGAYGPNNNEVPSPIVIWLSVI